MSCAVVLFTRDLRVRDQPALAAAAREAEHVVPLFVIDDLLLRGSCGSANRLAFLLDCLRDLDESLRERGTRLVLRRGDPVEEALRVAGECGAVSIHLSDDYSATPGGANGDLRPSTSGRGCGFAFIPASPSPSQASWCRPAAITTGSSPRSGESGPRRRTVCCSQLRAG